MAGTEYQFHIEPDVAEALIALLDLKPHEVDPEDPLVLTTAPSLWGASPRSRVVVSLERVMGLPGPVVAGSADHPYALQPSSVEELCTTVADAEPRALILDFTFLLSGIAGQWMPDREARRSWVAELSERVPANVRPEGRNPDAISILLAWATAAHSLQALTVIAPTGIAVHPGSQWLREHLCRALELSAVLDLPKGIFPRMRWLRATALFFGGRRGRTFVDAVASPQDLVRGPDHPWFERLQLWLSNEESTRTHVRQLAPADPWSSTPTPDHRDVEKQLARLGPLETLEGVCEVAVGKRIPSRDATSETGVPLIGSSALSNGFLDLESAPRMDVEAAALVPERAKLKTGDILLSTVITDCFTAVMHESAEPGILSDTVIVIRPRDGRVTREYLVEYLNSSMARRLIQSRARADAYLGIQRLGVTDMRQFPVPLIDPGLFDGLAQLEKTEEALRQKADELRRQRRDLFDAPNVQRFRRDLNHVKRRGNLFSRGIEKADSTAYQITNFFPFPIAFGYRLLSSLHDPVDRYKEQLRIVENMLAFLGCISLALLRPEDREVLDPRELWRGGMSPGNWREAVLRSCQTLGTYVRHPLAEALKGLDIGAGKGFGKDVQELITAKNDFKHDRGPKIKGEYEVESQQVQARLDRCMERLAFFTDFPLRQLQNYDRVRHGGWTVEYLSYTGDHPGLERCQETFETTLPIPDPIKDELYVLVEENWLSLYPFMSVQECTSCRTREVYFVDRWDERRGRADLKSFERGHTHVTAEVAQDLALWPQSAAVPA